jgi:hypothetical protein
MANGDQQGVPQLPMINCPVCGEVLHQQPGEPVTATSWDTCLRRCDAHRVGFSNAGVNPKMIYGHPQDRNVPEEVRSGALETLSVALNVANRPNKITKFGFSTSEDALTWIVFNFLHKEGRLAQALRTAGLAISEQLREPDAMLLWGVPVPLDRGISPRGWELRQQLEAISDALGERRNKRTEPDVLLDFGPDGIFIIEVKHRSGMTPVPPEDPRWMTYYPLPYAGCIRASRCYELARNWRFGLELQGEQPRPFTLVYLGPESLFQGERAAVLQPFEECLPQEGNARFQRMHWNVLLHAIPNPPGWLLHAVHLRGYLNDLGEGA